LVQLRKWGPEILQEVENYQPLEDRLLKASKASKTPRPKKRKAPPASPIIKYILPDLDFPDLPQPPLKLQSTALLPPLQSSAPSPSKQPSPKKITRRRTKKTKGLVDEVIEPLAIVTTIGRRSKRRLFHDEILAKALANQKEV
jgi:hypothetical protein